MTERAPKPRRRLWFQIHLWLGWITALPLLVVFVTGVLLAFEHEFYAWEQPEHYALDPQPTELTLPEVLDRLEQAELHINHLQIPDHPRVAYLAFASGIDPEGKQRGLRAYVNQYQDTLTKEWDNPTFIRQMEVWHRNLSTGQTGRWIVAVSSLLLVLIALAGFILWWPMRRGTLRRFQNQRRALDWHNIAGLLSLVPLIILGITGITFTWGSTVFPVLDSWTGQPSRAVIPALPELSPEIDTTGISLSAAAHSILRNYPDAQLRGVQGSRGDQPYKFMLQTKDSLFGHPSLQVYVDPRTGQEIGQWDARDTGLVGLYRRTFYVLHTGEPFSAWARGIWAAISAAGGLLLITGCWISLRRWTRNFSRRANA